MSCLTSTRIAAFAPTGRALLRRALTAQAPQDGAGRAWRKRPDFMEKVRASAVGQDRSAEALPATEQPGERPPAPR